MSLKKKASLIIYRFKERGLEVFLMDTQKDNEAWEFPNGELAEQNSDENHVIELDPVEKANGKLEQGVAIEGDWHEIPSLKKMLYDDAVNIKGKIKEMEKGTFVAVKEAIKKALPHQYKQLKELKDILVDRNSIRDL